MIARSLMTADEFAEICDALGPCELVRGEVVELSPGRPFHSSISSRATIRLGSWAENTNSGRVWTNEAGFVVATDPDTVRGADVAYISYRRLPKNSPDRGFVRVAPELVVEIIGKGQGWREMVEKAGEYLRMGVDRVWVIDPKTRCLHVYRSDRQPEILRESDTIRDDEILPGFSCVVAELFAD